MTTKFIKRAGDAPLRKPDGSYLAEQGEVIVWSTYWQRRLDDGDIIISDDPEHDAPKKDDK